MGLGDTAFIAYVPGTWSWQTITAFTYFIDMVYFDFFKLTLEHYRAQYQIIIIIIIITLSSLFVLRIRTVLFVSLHVYICLYSDMDP